MPFTGMVGAPGFGNCVTIAALCDMMEKNSRRRLGEDTFYLPWEDFLFRMKSLKSS